MEAQSLVSHQHSWWFSCFSLREKLARSHNRKEGGPLFKTISSNPKIVHLGLSILHPCSLENLP